MLGKFGIRARMPDRPNIIKQDVAEAREAGPRFLNRPWRWWDNPTWRCRLGHVSKRFLKSEAVGAGLCLKCGEYVWLTFPEDAEHRKGPAHA